MGFQEVTKRPVLWFLEATSTADQPNWNPEYAGCQQSHWAQQFSDVSRGGIRRMNSVSPHPQTGSSEDVEINLAKLY